MVTAMVTAVTAKALDFDRLSHRRESEVGRLPLHQHVDVGVIQLRH